MAACHQRADRAWGVGRGAQERRSAGAQERRSAGAQERRSAGAQERRSAGAQAQAPRITCDESRVASGGAPQTHSRMHSRKRRRAVSQCAAITISVALAAEAVAALCIQQYIPIRYVPHRSDSTSDKRLTTATATASATVTSACLTSTTCHSECVGCEQRAEPRTSDEQLPFAVRWRWMG